MEVSPIILFLFTLVVVLIIWKYVHITLGGNFPLLFLVAGLSACSYITVRYGFLVAILYAYNQGDWRQLFGFSFLFALAAFITVYIMCHAYKLLRKQRKERLLKEKQNE